MARKTLVLLALLAWVTLISSEGYADRDEFSSPKLDPAWIWDNPAKDSSYSLAEKPGWVKITCAAGDHDIWDVRSGGPALLMKAPDNYTIETHYVTEVKNNCSAGVVFLNEDAVGNAQSVGPWCALFTQPPPGQLFWQHAVGMDVKQANVANTAEVYVKVEKEGKNWKFYYKEKKEGNWALVIEDSYDIGKVHYAGLMAKNWNPGPEYSAYFDYVETSWSFLSPVEPANKLVITWGKIKQR